MTTELIKIVANGTEKTITGPCNVSEFIHQCGWKPTQVVVEYNGNILPRKDMSSAWLQTGDQLEIIVPVAGG